MNTILEALKHIENRFSTQPHPASIVQNSRHEAQLIVSHVTNLPFLEIYIHKDKQLTYPEKELIESYLTDRLSGKPLQYIFGKVQFMGLEFNVDHNVLIPRLETELLVKRIIEDATQLPDNNTAVNKKILDIGTGSGAIAISLAHYLRQWKVDAADISEKALAVAAKNAIQSKVQIDFIYSDIFDMIEDKYDIIVSNPPYISQREYDTLEEQIVRFEPQSALLAAEYGLYFYRRILAEATDYLTSDGTIYFEIGANQAVAVKELAVNNGFKSITKEKDYNGFDRILIIKRENK